jgi:SAM-dependent methyltransferase
VAVYDDVASCYDQSRGGEQRGDDYAEELEKYLQPGDGPVLDVGVGTGVIALGLERRGWRVIGIDVAAQMLIRAQARLTSGLVRGDGRRLPFRDGSMAHAVSVWVVHAVTPPEMLFGEVKRVLRPKGRYLVCPTARLGADDLIAPILDSMFERASRLHPTWTRNPVVVDDILDLGLRSGFIGKVETSPGSTWSTSRDEQISAIADRVWPALQGIDDPTFRAVTEPALEALAALPDGPLERHSEVDIAVLTAP